MFVLSSMSPLLLPVSCGMSYTASGLVGSCTSSPRLPLDFFLMMQKYMASATPRKLDTEHTTAVNGTATASAVIVSDESVNKDLPINNRCELTDCSETYSCLHKLQEKS